MEVCNCFLIVGKELLTDSRPCPFRLMNLKHHDGPPLKSSIDISLPIVFDFKSFQQIKFADIASWSTSVYTVLHPRYHVRAHWSQRERQEKTNLRVFKLAYRPRLFVVVSVWWVRSQNSTSHNSGFNHSFAFIICVMEWFHHVNMAQSVFLSTVWCWNNVIHITNLFQGAIQQRVKGSKPDPPLQMTESESFGHTRL